MVKAIVEDNPAKVRLLLKKEKLLATRSIAQGQYETGIAHWIYANDTALHVAAAGYRVEIARILINSGADVNASRNHLLSRPLHYAADGWLNNSSGNAKRQIAMMRLLIESGAVIDAPDKNSATALHHAVRNRCVTSVRCLLAAGANATAQNKSGLTPFHLAVRSLDRRETNVEKARSAQRSIIETFLEHGISASLPDAKGASVLTTARSAWIRDILNHCHTRRQTCA